MNTKQFYKLSCLFLAIIFTQVLWAQEKVLFSDSWGNQGITLQQQSTEGLQINFSVNQYNLTETMVDRKSMQSVSMKGVLLQGQEDAPNLPAYSKYVAIPQGARASIKLISFRTETIENIEIAPSPRIPLETEDGPLQYRKNQAIYSADELFPAQMVQLSDPLKIRGVDVVLLAIHPFQYNPVTKELRIHRDIEFEVVFEGGNGHFGEDRLRNRHWEPILRDAILNQASIPALKEKAVTADRSTNECEYLIITPDDQGFKRWADTIRKFRIRQGITTNIVTTEEIGGNTTTVIETFINECYNNWETPPAAVLLIGDYGSSGNTIVSPIYDNYCASDNIYADVDGDHLPDIVFARMTAQNEDMLERLVMKAIDYERNPPTNPDFYNNPISAMGWQTERWFQMCSEIIAGYFENEHGKEVVRENAIYSGNNNGPWSTAQNTQTILDEFGEDGLNYIPNSPSYLSDWGGNATRLNDDINSGAFLLQHRDHGSTTGWGEPAYSSSDIDGLYNTDLTFVFSINCLTGKYNISGECFAEKFHRYEYGALGIIAASETSYSFVNDTYLWGMYDNMWPDFMPEYGTTPESRDVKPAFGNAAGKYFLKQSSWPYNTGNKEVTYHLFHHHGDAFTNLYYEMPQYLSVVHDEVLISGLNYLTVKSNPGSFICLTVDGDIIATAEATGGPYDISIPFQEPGTMIDIVITGQNFYRYESQVEVIPPDGPYCLYQEHSVSDSLGNGNDKVEFGEEILISMIMKNLGNEDAVNVGVSLVTNPDFVTFIDGSETFDTIKSKGNVTTHYGYKLRISNGIPDQHQLQFDVHACDEQDSTWDSKFFMVVNAPRMTPEDIEIDDSEFGNDNGRLDPGETAEVIVNVSNKGHCIIRDVSCTLESWNQYITVNSEEQVVPVIGFLGGAKPRFEVTVADDVPEGLNAKLKFIASGAGYLVNKMYQPKVGMLLEDWETGDFEKFDWEFSGNEPWVITTEYPYEGSFHATSGDIGGNQSSKFKITYKVMGNDNITFYRKVSSELDADKLKFFVDGTLRGSWSGTSQGWRKESFPIGQGQHTFEWVYQKDYSGDEGADRAWIDHIELPTEMVTTLFAGPDDESCIDNSFFCKGSATNYKTVYWTTAGDGEFSNDSILSPAYLPGSADFATGEVALTMHIIDAADIAFEDEMILTFKDVLGAPEKPVGPDYVDVFTMTETRYGVLEMASAKNYVWELWPENAGTLVSFDTTAIALWNDQYLGEASLKVSAVDDCGMGLFSDSLIIFVDNTVGAFEENEQLHMIVAPNPNNGTFRLLFQSEHNDMVHISLRNFLGMEVLNKKLTNLNGSATITIQEENLESGVYILTAKQNGKRFSRKVLIH